MAINPGKFLNELISHGISFFTGVPDSLLKDFCLCVDEKISKNNNIIAPNEGNAVALGAGYNLATGELPLVYMQNSGIGNAINPLLSLCDPDVYSIPLLVLIGWRGEPGIKDEPQHVKQGKIQIELLKVLGLPYKILSKDDIDFKAKVNWAISNAKSKNVPTVLLIRKGTFEKYKIDKKVMNPQRMSRENSLEIILSNLGNKTIVVSTTGKTSREIFEIREKNGELHNQDFLTVGSMGHCSTIALGIALAKPNRKVICIDGDGAMLMHLGAITTVASLKPHNFFHILLNNEVHDSVGGQATAAENIDLSSMVKSTNAINTFVVQSKIQLKSCISEILKSNGPTFLEVKINSGSRSDLGRPTIGPKENKNNFMKFMEN